MKDFINDISLRIASYGEASDMLHLALTCRRFGSISDDGMARRTLMDEAARRIVLKATEGGNEAHFLFERKDWKRLQKRVAAKMSNEAAVNTQGAGKAAGQDEVEEESSWIGLYHELGLIQAKEKKANDRSERLEKQMILGRTVGERLQDAMARFETMHFGVKSE